MTEKQTHKIKARSHILSLLGEELIGSDSLAIFELVKNSYDADAENVTVSFINLNTKNQKIVIEDDGSGMSPKIIEDVWLTIGTDFKRGKNRKVSPKYDRVSFGNKGVGRLAVHKLAREIELETQQTGQMFSNKLKINWDKLIQSKEYIQELEVNVETVPNLTFPKGQGTRITLSDLTTVKWSQRDFRNLVRKIKNIENPFKQIDNNFNVQIICNDWHSEWIEDIAEPSDNLENCLYKFSFKVEKTDGNENDFAKIEWDYKFNPHENTGLEKNFLNSEAENFLIGDLYKEIEGFDSNEKPLFNKYLRNRDLSNLGPISGEFFVYNLNKPMLEDYFPGQINAIKNFVSENKGVRIFRDGIRVYNYGEPNDDWLELDLMKIKRIGDHFGKKVTIGYVDLNLADSEEGLIEKTNREGFIENQYYTKFQLLVNRVFEFFETQSSKDKDSVDNYIEQLKPIKKIGFGETLDELKEKIVSKNLEKELDPYLRKIDKDYMSMQDIMVNSGMTGLNLGIAFHEVEREIKFLNKDIENDEIQITEIKNRVTNILMLLESLSPLLRKNKKTIFSAKKIIDTAYKINKNRFSYHDLIFSSPVLTNENPDFDIKGATNLLIGAVSNIMDNSIYWTTAKRDLEGGSFQPALFMGTDLETYDAPAIIIADNGVGFNLDPEYLKQPFKTQKENGIGLGLYFVDLVMKMSGGRLIFPDTRDLEIPRVYNGACLALIFPKN